MLKVENGAFSFTCLGISDSQKNDVKNYKNLIVNKSMDKLAYHYNKKKIPAETEGKYLYYYPYADVENATVKMGKNGYIVIEVTEKEWEALFELDRIDYNNEHKYVRHTSPISDDEEDELPVEEQEAFISDETPIPTATAEKMDKENLFAKLSEDDRQI